MKTLREYILEAEKNKVAIGHFNVSDVLALKGIFAAAKELSDLAIKNPPNPLPIGRQALLEMGQVPVIIGVSEGEAGFIGYEQIADLVKGLREEHGFPIFLNADHTKSLEKIKEAVEAGFDAVLFDAGRLPLEENIKKTKEVVEYVKSISVSQGRDILVEAELGYLGSSSVILEKVPEGANIKKEDLTKPEEAKRFVQEAGVDLLAPAVGNIHGMFKNESNPDIDVERIREIREAAGIPLVLHGGSGIKDADFLEAIASGVSIIHINTEVRLAWRRGFEKALDENPDEVVPYKIMPMVIEEIKDVVSKRLKLFNKLV